MRPTMREYRKLKHDYTQADEMYDQGYTLKEISDSTGISKSTLHTHFFICNYKRDYSWTLELPQIKYKERLDKMLKALQEATGITDWMTEEGQKVLENFTLKKDYIRAHNTECDYPNMEGI